MTTLNLNNQPNVNNSSVVLAAQPSEMGVREMSSLEIAELTGKQHSNVMRDIRALLDQGVNQINFELVDYTDKKGEKRSMYNLTKKGSLILASGYNAVLREKIIDRWESIETGQATPMYQVVQQSKESDTKKVTPSKKRVEAFGAWVTMLSSAMNLDEYSKYMLIKQEGEQLMFPVPEAPVCEAPVDNLTNLLNAHNVMNGNKPMKAHAFHVLLVNKGYMREIPRAKSNGKPDNYYSFTDKGLKFGINRWDKYSSSPKSKDYFFIDKFIDLLKELNLK